MQKTGRAGEPGQSPDRRAAWPRPQVVVSFRPEAETEPVGLAVGSEALCKGREGLSFVRVGPQLTG